MTLGMMIVMGLLLLALVLFISEALPMDLVALLVMAGLAVTGILSPAETFAGFANPAVVTVWAMFILSDGLTRTGIAKLIGRQVLRLGGGHEARLIAVIMLTSGCLSAFMNNIGVAALLLPVTVHIAGEYGDFALPFVDAAGFCLPFGRAHQSHRYTAQPVGRGCPGRRGTSALRFVRFYAGRFGLSAQRHRLRGTFRAAPAARGSSTRDHQSHHQGRFSHRAVRDPPKGVGLSRAAPLPVGRQDLG